MADFYKIEHTILSNNSINVYLREMKTEVHTANVNCSFIPNSQKPISSRIDKNIVVLQYTIEYFSIAGNELITANKYMASKSIAVSGQANKLDDADMLYR